MLLQLNIVKSNQMALKNLAIEKNIPQFYARSNVYKSRPL
jgi:hypothetical protein